MPQSLVHSPKAACTAVSMKVPLKPLRIFFTKLFFFRLYSYDTHMILIGTAAAATSMRQEGAKLLAAQTKNKV